MMYWRSIETAPKGVDVLVWCPGSDDDDANLGMSLRGVFVAFCARGLWTSGELAIGPTHWMPLPAPPSKNRAAGPFSGDLYEKARAIILGEE